MTGTSALRRPHWTLLVFTNSPAADSAQYPTVSVRHNASAPTVPTMNAISGNSSGNRNVTSVETNPESVIVW